MSQSEKRQSRSSKMSYGGSISDIETDEIEKYRKMAKKLSRDKSDLKDKLRRLLDEIDQKTHDHRIELEKTQDYFQDQINELVEERDRAREEIENIRENSIEEKDRMRQQYEQKISKQRESLEKRYGGKDSQIIKRLENTIVTLQERFDQQENAKETAEQIYNQKEELLHRTITDLEEQLRKVKETCVKDRKDMQTEKEQVIRKIQYEKDEIVQNILKNSTIQEQLEKRTLDLDRRRDALILQAKQETEQIRADAERKQSEFAQGCKKSMDEFKLEYERKLAAIDSNHKIELECTINEHEKIIQNLTAENSRKIDMYTNNVRRESEDNKKLIKALQSEVALLTQTKQDDISRKEQEMKKYNVEYRTKYEEKEKQIIELTRKNDKIVGESEETIQRLKEQLLQVRENMKKVQDNSQMINNQFVLNLNKQKELAEKEIYVRDQTIAHLEQKMKKIIDESVEHFNSLDRKARIAIEEHKDMAGKCTNLKVNIEKYEQTITTLKNDIQKLKEALELATGKFRHLELEKSLSEQKMKAEADMKAKEFENSTRMAEEYKKKMTTLTSTLLQVQSQQQIIADALAANKQGKHVNDHNLKMSLEKSKQSVENLTKDLETKTIENKKLLEDISIMKSSFSSSAITMNNDIKAQDNALANLHQSKIELTRIKDEAIQSVQKYEKEMIVKNDRIKELENLLSGG